MENTAQPILIDGRIIAKTIKEEIRKEVSDLLDAGKRPPHLVAVIVGEDGASLSYVASKEKQSKEVGFTSSVYRFPETITEKELLETLDFLNIEISPSNLDSSLCFIQLSVSHDVL